MRTATFTAIDGEGYTEGKKHYYNIIVASCYDRGFHSDISLSTGRLSTWNIFFFLTSRLYKVRDTTFVAFYFNYDVTKWLTDLTIEQRTELWNNKTITVESPDGLVYEVFYIPSKIFKLTHIYYKNDKIKKYSVTIYDTSGFFQRSFVKALEQWGIDAGKEMQEMKSKRSIFLSQETERILDYSYDECDKLCQLMNKVRDALYAENIPLTKWFGAGAIAQRLLEINNTRNAIAVPGIVDNSDLESALLGSYFGGRFELFRQGIISETYQYDINSAYPYAMSQLPNLEGCRIQYSREYTRDKYSIWFVTYNVLRGDGKKQPTKYANAQTFLAGPFPYRTKQGNIFYPYLNSYGVWIHQIELQTAITLYGVDYFRIHYGYIITPINDTPYFDFITNLADRRLKLKLANDQRNIVLKLGLNSLYGKTAQGQTSPDYKPPFQNMYIAGYITAYTRAKLLQQSFQCGAYGSGVIQFATDGIAANSPARNITKTSSDFGGWEYEYFDENICYIQAGVYYGERSVKTNKKKTRGFNANTLDADNVIKSWKDYFYLGEPITLMAKETRFIGIGSCLVDNKWGKYGTFVEQDRMLSFLGPPTKHYSSHLKTDISYGMMTPKIIGLSKSEVDEKKEFYYLVPDEDRVDRISEPFKSHKMRDIIGLPDETQEMIKALIMRGEQPDIYEE